MARSLSLSPCLAGDPARLGNAVSAEDVLASLGLGADGAPAVVRLGSRIALVHALSAEAPAFRWIHLPHTPTMGLGGEGFAQAVVLTAAVAGTGVALRLAGRLRACIESPGFLEATRDATTREALVRILAAADERGGEGSLAAAEVLQLLRSSAHGLSSSDAALRLAACGPNRIERMRRRPLALRFLEQFTSFFALLLLAAAGCAFLARMPELGVAVLAVIAVNGVFSFLQEYRAERAVEALQQLLPHRVAVLRDGLESRLDATQIVPGDCVRLEEGDQVPADGQLLEAAALRVDQSPLTGESHPVFKLPAAAQAGAARHLERHDLLFAGSSVVSGSATLVVTATGMATEIGAIARLTQSVVEQPSPLQREMARVTRVVTALAVGVGLGFFLIAVASRAMAVSDGLLFALGVIVANVPEGLLPTLTLALALGVQRMARRRSVVKRLSSVETLGATTVICTDKTGTLTENRMALRFVRAAAGVGAFDPAKGREDPEVRVLLEAAVLASQATLERGDPTEVALLAAALAVGVDPVKTRDANHLLAPYPFDSFRKRMTLVRAADGRAVAYVKGAPRETLALCTSIRARGRTRPLDDDARAAILADQDRMAREGLRLLAVAVRPLPETLVGEAAAAVEADLVFLGLVALWDPPRPEVRDSVELCRRAGIRVVMVTGDYGLTAQAIAGQVGLEVAKVVTGEELERLPPEAVARLVAEPGVLFARTSPAHKLAIVNALKAQGEVVAVTGDGVNDAPALRAADIGVAMGKRGSDVAKEAAVMVILDDNFASIVAAIRHGRSIYANVGKFITYIFASNVPELVPFLASVFLGIPLPLTVMQILAVDLGTDLVPALALGAEPPEPGVMDAPPRQRSRRLLGAGRLIRAYGFLGLAEAALSLSGFFWVYWLSGWRPGLPMAASGDLYLRATTMSLCGIVAAQVGNVFACRTERESVFRVGLFKNRLVLLGIACELALVTTLIAVRPLRHAFGLAPLSPRECAPLIVFPPAMLLLEESRKWVMRRVSRRHPSHGRVPPLLAVLLLAVALAPRGASAGVHGALPTDTTGRIFELGIDQARRPHRTAARAQTPDRCWPDSCSDVGGR